MKDVLINATQLSCKVGTRYLLNQINWTVHKGEQWVIFGMNGSGKTTLLRTKYSAVPPLITCKTAYYIFLLNLSALINILFFF